MGARRLQLFATEGQLASQGYQCGLLKRRMLLDKAVWIRAPTWMELQDRAQANIPQLTRTMSAHTDYKWMTQRMRAVYAASDGTPPSRQ